MGEKIEPDTQTRSIVVHYHRPLFETYGNRRVTKLHQIPRETARRPEAHSIALGDGARHLDNLRLYLVRYTCSRVC